MRTIFETGWMPVQAHWTGSPVSLGQASRVPGVRQADLAVLLVLLKKGRR